MPELLRQFIRFAGVGCMSAIGHYGLLILLVQVVHTDAVLASAAGALLGAVINYLLNYHFTFQSSKKHHESIAKFVVVAAVGLGLNTLFMWIMVSLLGLHYLLSQVVTTGLVLIWSFVGNRFWTFHEAPISAEKLS
ncbi:MAG: GtrA family protein [Proteobacteria bacterium]|nr:GtrA family protein [Pseudomonadota bacterium]